MNLFLVTLLLQPVVGPGGMSVAVPAGATVTVAGGTSLVPVSNSVAIASGPLPAQFITTGLKSGNQTIQPAPGTPLTLLQVQYHRLKITAGQQATSSQNDNNIIRSNFWVAGHFDQSCTRKAR